MESLTYKEYKEKYGGTLEEQEFYRFERQARRIINYYTYNRIKDLDKIPLEVRECMLDLIEYEVTISDNGGKDIQAETVDTHSITYATAKTDEDLTTFTRRKIVREHLLHTRLMYRGVDK